MKMYSTIDAGKKVLQEIFSVMSNNDKKVRVEYEHRLEKLLLDKFKDFNSAIYTIIEGKNIHAIQAILKRNGYTIKKSISRSYLGPPCESLEIYLYHKKKLVATINSEYYI